MISEIRERLNATRAIVVCTAAALLVLYWLRNSSTPQLGTNEAVLSNVDALFTALSVRDPELVESCERRIQSQTTQGILNVNCSEHLLSIVHQADLEDWESAAGRLYEFMYAQRGTD